MRVLECCNLFRNSDVSREAISEAGVGYHWHFCRAMQRSAVFATEVYMFVSLYVSGESRMLVAGYAHCSLSLVGIFSWIVAHASR